MVKLLTFKNPLKFGIITNLVVFRGLIKKTPPLYRQINGPSYILPYQLKLASL
jgi:hypothetical protein